MTHFYTRCRNWKKKVSCGK